ncbi:MAG: hypothetical protein HOB14_03025 [Gammaproteobacteria bacterium]|nr:hypothetical protein [Gammaproteobacteria bacterium]MBT6454223.1 hypothetical protein [Gammaproteobacteria bacterium]MBT6700608.1 hypothetical protein [Gammaproteobacteria bacterium]
MLITLLLFVSKSVNSADLNVQLNKNETEMGKFIVAMISYQGEKNPGLPDLSDWEGKFYVDVQGNESFELPDGQLQSETRVRLYPRVSGNLSLASLALGGAIAKSQQLIVKPLIRNDIDSTPIIRPLQADYWADQAIMIQVDVSLYEKRNNVVVNDFEIDGFVVRSLKPQRINAEAGDVIRLQWMLLTPSPGHYEIELPSIQQRGRSRFRFYLPKLKLSIKPIPAYLPATVPVGRHSVNSDLVYSKNMPASWLLRIENKGRIPAQVEGLQDFFEQKGIASDDVNIDHQIDDRSSKVVQLYEIKIPNWNLWSANEVNLAYFNTATGRLEFLEHTLPRFWNIPKYAQHGLIYLLMLIFFYVANRIDKFAQNVRDWRKFRMLLQQSSTGNQLREGLLNNVSFKHLTEWADYFHGSFPKQIALDLNELCFDRESQIKVDDIKNQCLEYFTYNQSNIYIKQS